MIKITLTFEMDEEQLKDMFEANEVKFSKKKAKELQEELEGTHDDVQIQLEDSFEEIVDEMIRELFE
jgi:lipoate-protein ligase A